MNSKRQKKKKHETHSASQYNFTCKVANLYEDIGLAYFEMRDYAKALEYLNKALPIRESSSGCEAPQTLKVKEKISKIEAKMKETETENK